MEKYDNNESVDYNKSELSVVKYASYLIFLAMVAVLSSSFFNFIRGTAWSFGLIMNMLVHGFGYILLYIILAIHIKKKYDISLQLVSKKLRIPTLIAFILFIVFNLAIF